MYPNRILIYIIHNPIYHYHKNNRILNSAVYSPQLNILHNNIGIYRKHVLVWEQWFVYGAAIISGYIAASGAAREYVIGTNFE
jgi:hypothetical protein